MTRNFYDPSSCSWYRLNLDVTHALLPEFADFCRDPGTELHLIKPEKALTEQWRQWASERYGIEFFNVLLFSRDNSETDLTAHIDIPSLNIVCSINWCLGPDLRPMQWWDIPPVINRHYVDPGSYWKPTAEGVMTRTQHMTRPMTKIEHQQFYCSELILRDQCTIGNQPTLVRVDQPHSIALGVPDRRICISLRFQPLSRPWEDTVKIFAQDILPD